jgi:hypothetical protein
LVPSYPDIAALFPLNRQQYTKIGFNSVLFGHRNSNWTSLGSKLSYCLLVAVSDRNDEFKVDSAVGDGDSILFGLRHLISSPHCLLNNVAFTGNVIGNHVQPVGPIVQMAKEEICERHHLKLLCATEKFPIKLSAPTRKLKRFNGPRRSRSLNRRNSISGSSSNNQRNNRSNNQALDKPWTLATLIGRLIGDLNRFLSPEGHYFPTQMSSEYFSVARLAVPRLCSHLIDSYREFIRHKQTIKVLVRIIFDHAMTYGFLVYNSYSTLQPTELSEAHQKTFNVITDYYHSTFAEIHGNMYSTIPLTSSQD